MTETIVRKIAKKNKKFNSSTSLIDYKESKNDDDQWYSKPLSEYEIWGFIFHNDPVFSAWDHVANLEIFFYTKLRYTRDITWEATMFNPKG